ncbi:unnamed protein product [Chrysoparadoxa australica]
MVCNRVLSAGAWLLLPYLGVRAAPFPQVLDPQFTACSRRCGLDDIGREDVQFRCMTTDAGEHCATLAFGGPESCHLHHFSQEEMGQCLAGQQYDYIIIGGSTAIGHAVTAMQWFDATIQDQARLNMPEWLAPIGVDQPSDQNFFFAGAQVVVDAGGGIADKSSILEETGVGYNDMLAPPAGEGTAAITFMDALSVGDANARLDALAEAGRADRKSLIQINIGIWDVYCLGFGLADGGWACNYPGGDEVLALRDNPDQVFANLQDGLLAIADRCLGEFPNSTILLEDFSFTGEWVLAVPYFEAVREIMKQVANVRENVIYLGFSYMQASPNAPERQADHPTHAMGFAVFQRALSAICVTPENLNAECDEQVLMSSSCFVDNVGFAADSNQFYDQLNRPCDSQAVLLEADALPPAPPGLPETPPLTPVAPPSRPTTTDGLPAVESGLALLLDPSPLPAFTLAATAVQGSVPSMEASTATTISDGASIGGDSIYTAWGYNPAQLVVLLIAVAVVVGALAEAAPWSKWRALAGRVSTAELVDWKAWRRWLGLGGAGRDGQDAVRSQAPLTSAPSPVGGASEQEDGMSKREMSGGSTGRAGAEKNLPATVAAAGGGGGGKADWGYLSAFDGARFAAALHVVAGHYAADGAKVITSKYIMNWGFTWVPWFLMLSGFVLTYASLKREAEGKPHTSPPLAFLLKRVQRIYPVYVLGLIIAYCIALSNGSWVNITWVEAISSMTLTQAWLPTITELVVQPHCWFLSAIIPLWYFHGKIQKVVSGLSCDRLWAMMVVIMLLPWMLVVILPHIIGVDVNWYSQHAWGNTTTWTDILVVVFKFHPMSYIHVYTFGVGLACLLRDYRHDPPLLFKYGATIGYLGLTLIFSVPELRPPAAKLSCRLGVLAPLQGLLLLGLAFRVDPLARLLSTYVCRQLGAYSYAQYVLQFVVLALWKGWADFGYFIVLLASAILATHIGRATGSNDEKVLRRNVPLLASLFVLSFVLWHTIPTGLVTEWGASQDSGATPAVVTFPSGAFDERLKLTAEGLLDDRFDANEYSIINPSALQVGDQLFVAARRHRLSSSTASATTTHTWHSDIVFGELDPDTLEPLAPLLKVDVSPPGSNGWVPCVAAPTFNAQNGTYSQQVVTGPQDPRLLLRGDSLSLSFFSTLPNLRGACPSTGSAGTLFAVYADMTAWSGQPVTAIELAARDAQLIEKNWMGFDPADGSESTKWVQHIAPFTVMTTEDSQVTEMQTPITTPLDYSGATLKVALHGGSNALLVAPGFGAPYYLSVFHTLDQAGGYINYLFRFSSAEPYEPIAVSRPLPLVQRSPECPTFASGLTLDPSNEGSFLVLYGSCDEESRALHVTARDVNTLFERDDVAVAESSLPEPVAAVSDSSPWEEGGLVALMLFGSAAAVALIVLFKRNEIKRVSWRWPKRFSVEDHPQERAGSFGKEMEEEAQARPAPIGWESYFCQQSSCESHPPRRHSGRTLSKV